MGLHTELCYVGRLDLRSDLVRVRWHCYWRVRVQYVMPLPNPLTPMFPTVLAVPEIERPQDVIASYQQPTLLIVNSLGLFFW